MSAPLLWTVCPNCHQRAGVPFPMTTEPAMNHFECEQCGHIWKMPKRGDGGRIASAPRVMRSEPRACPYCGELAGIEFDVDVGRYRCMRPGCRYKAALQQHNH